MRKIRDTNLMILSSDDEDDCDYKPNSHRSYTKKPKSRSFITRTNPRQPKKPRVSGSRSRFSRDSPNLFEVCIPLFCFISHLIVYFLLNVAHKLNLTLQIRCLKLWSKLILWFLYGVLWICFLIFNAGWVSWRRFWRIVFWVQGICWYAMVVVFCA